MITPESAIDLGRKIGVFVAAGLLIVPGVVVIVWNLLARRRPRTNSKCALSVVFATVVILILGISGLAEAAFETSAIFRSLSGLAALLALIVAVVLAINGLKEMNNRFGIPYDHGRKRAIAVLVLPFLFATGIVASVVMHSSGRPVFGSQIGGTAGETVIDKARNFQLIAPPPWVATDAARVHPDACAALARQGPQMFTIVIAEDVSKAGTFPLDAAASAVKAKLKESAHEIVAEGEQNEGGLRGHRIESLGGGGGNPAFHVHWLARHSDTLYQLKTWGAPGARDQVRADARTLAAGFRIIDPNPNPIAQADRAPSSFVSEKFGYAVDLANTVWSRRWPGLEQEVPFAEFGVLNARGSAAFCLIPVWLGDDDPGFEAIATALAARIGIPFPDPSLFAMRNIRQGSVRGRAFAFERAQGDVNLLYRVRIVRGRGFAYLLATWMNKKVEAASEFLDLAMDCVSFPEKAAADPLLTGDRLRVTHSAVWNDIGLALVRAGTPQPALRWFERAYEIHRDNLVPLANYADTLIKTGRATDALATLARHARGDERPAMRRLHAQVLQANGKLDQALGMLIELRKLDPNDAETAILLIDSFLGAQRFAEVISECDALMAAAGEVPALLQRKAVAQAQLKNFREAKLTLEKASAKEPQNPDIKRLIEQVTALMSTPAK